MAFNPNYVPWMSILGVIGAGIGYLIGGGGNNFQSMAPVLYGMVAGSMAGIVVRIVLRYYFRSKPKTETQPSDKTSDI